jgi:hypothetical protein
MIAGGPDQKLKDTVEYKPEQAIGNQMSEADVELMCKISSKLGKKNRRNPKVIEREPVMKKLTKETIIRLEGDYGTGVGPRRIEEVIPSPMYETVDLFNTNEEILFQGELAKFKACINPGFNLRWLVVTPNAVRYYKGRCNAVASCNKPLMALPVKAIESVIVYDG